MHPIKYSNMKKTTPYWILGHKVVSFKQTENYDLLIGETPAKRQGPHPHFHHVYDETFLITEGEMEFLIDGEIKQAKAGEFVHISPKSLHTFNNKSDTPCKWINIHSPKGFSSFLEKFGIPAEEENAQERSVSREIVKEAIETATDFDVHLKL